MKELNSIVKLNVLRRRFLNIHPLDTQKPSSYTHYAWTQEQQVLQKE